MVARGDAREWIRANGGCYENQGDERCAGCDLRREKAVWDGVDWRYEIQPRIRPYASHKARKAALKV